MRWRGRKWYLRWVLSSRASTNSERSKFTIINGVIRRILIPKPLNDGEEKGLLNFSQNEKTL